MAEAAMPLRPLPVILVLGFGQTVAFASSYYLLGVLADPMAQAFDVSPGRLFAALSIAFLISAVLTPAAGRAIERFSGRRVQAAAHLAFALALMVMAIASGPLLLLTGIALLGFGMAMGLYGTAFATLVQLQGKDARRAITAVSLIGALGGGLGWPVSRALIELADWRLACAVWAAAHILVCLPLTLLLVRRTTPHQTTSELDRSPIFWDRRMIQLAGVFAGGWMVSTAMGAHLPRLLGDLGLTPAHAAWAAGLMAAAAVSARLFDLLVLHRSHPVLTVRIASLLHPLGALAALTGGAKLAPLLALGQGAGNGLLSVASGVLPLHVFGPDRYAVRQALLLTPARYLQAAAPAVFAIALDAGVLPALLLSSALCLSMMVMTLGLGRAQE